MPVNEIEDTLTCDYVLWLEHKPNHKVPWISVVYVQHHVDMFTSFWVNDK